MSFCNLVDCISDSTFFYDSKRLNNFCKKPFVVIHMDLARYIILFSINLNDFKEIKVCIFELFIINIRILRNFIKIKQNVQIIRYYT